MRLTTFYSFILVPALAFGCSSSSPRGDAGAVDGDAGDASTEDGDAMDALFNAPSCEAESMHLWDYGRTNLGIYSFWQGQVTGTVVPASASVSTTVSGGRVSVGFAAGSGKDLTAGFYAATGSDGDPAGPALIVELFDLRCAGEPGEFIIEHIHTHAADGGVEGLVLDSLKARWTQQCTWNGEVHSNAGCINFTGAVRDGGADGPNGGG